MTAAVDTYRATPIKRPGRSTGFRIHVSVGVMQQFSGSAMIACTHIEGVALIIHRRQYPPCLQGQADRCERSMRSPCKYYHCTHVTFTDRDDIDTQLQSQSDRQTDSQHRAEPGKAEPSLA